MARFVVFSVEIRKERHEAFSEIGGFFKNSNSASSATDERERDWACAHQRSGRDAYLYRTRLGRHGRRGQLFSGVVDGGHQLAAKPLLLSHGDSNCHDTGIQHDCGRIIRELPLDYRLLLSGQSAGLHVQTPTRAAKLGYSPGAAQNAGADH